VFQSDDLSRAPAPDPSRPRPVFTRRHAAQAAAWTALSYVRIWGAKERVGTGDIGLGNRGDQVPEAFLEFGDQQTVAVGDLKQDCMDFAVRKSRANPRRYTGYRKLLEDPDVDAVVIATPDHWPAIQLLDACRAGKDVYGEKPLSLTVIEGRRMVEVAAETRRVTQVGLPRRSARVLQEAAKLVRGGAIGTITFAQA